MPDPGIQMKILRKTGEFNEILEDIRLGDLSQHDNDDLQHLILIPKNPMQGKWAKGLRILFYSLALASILGAFLIVARDHHTSRLTEVSVMF